MRAVPSFMIDPVEWHANSAIGRDAAVPVDRLIHAGGYDHSLLPGRCAAALP